jgi:peptidoglycan hydrolase CwlO-like protein
MSSLEDDERKMEKEVRSLQEKIVELAESKKVYNEAYDSIEDDIERWERLKDDLNEGKSVYAPDQAKRKRTRSASPKRSKKRRKEEDDSDDDFVVSDEESEAQSDDSGSESDPDSDAGTQASRQPLTEEEINAKLDELKESKKNARRQRAELELQIKDLRPQVQETKSRLAEVRAEMDAICIAGRNEYSRGAIQLDFAAGIKEIDQENAAEEDEENFNPDEDIRDYEQVARSLPVFCVSSRAYQKLSGRLVKDSNVPGFKTLEETEIPQLQAHCKKLTEANRIHTCKAFLLDLKRQLNTFSLWACDDGDGLKLTDDQKRSQVQHLNRRLTELEQVSTGNNTVGDLIPTM